MRNFEQWYADLTSDQLWYELLRAYKDETIRKASEKVYAQLVADKIVDLRPVSENRKHVYNIVCKLPGDKPRGKSWSEIALEKQVQKSEAEEEWKPASREHVDKCVKEFHEMLANSPMITNQRIPVYARYNVSPAIKIEPHPITTAEQAYEKERHIEYLKKNYDAKTGEKLPTWISEREFNKLYDEGLI
jgi:hypothetical protein